MELSDVFLAARDKLRELGWTKETMQDEEGRVCLRGSILAAFGCMESSAGDRNDIDSAVYTLEEYCKKEYKTGTIALNDDYLNSEDDAANVLEGASKWAAERKENGPE